MMKRIFVLLHICLLVIWLLASCTKKDETPASGNPQAQQETPVAEKTENQQLVETGEKQPIRLGESTVEKTTVPTPAPKPIQKSSPVMNAVKDDMKQLLLNSQSVTIKSTDMDIGVLPVSGGEPVDILAGNFLSAVFNGQKYASYVETEYQKLMTNIVSTLRSSISVDDFRQGEKRHHGNGYFVPFRVFAGSSSGIGTVLITAVDGEWFVQYIVKVAVL